MWLQDALPQSQAKDTVRCRFLRGVETASEYLQDKRAYRVKSKRRYALIIKYERD